MPGRRGGRRDERIERAERRRRLLEPGEVSGLGDGLEPCARDRGGVRAPVLLADDVIRLAPEHQGRDVDPFTRSSRVGS